MADLIAPKPVAPAPSDQSAPASPTATTPVVPAPSTPTTPEERSTSFRPIEGGTEMQSGERLLVEAYVAFWLVVFLFVLASWRRQRKLDGRIDALEAALARSRKDAEAAAPARAAGKDHDEAVEPS